MNDLLPFLWTFFASSILAGALAAAGAHIASRQRTLQSLCLAQGAEMGALVSVFVAYISHDFLDRGDTWLGLGGSLLGALIAGAAASRIAGIQGSSRTPRLFAFWVALIAATHLSVSLHPALESHLARVFLGDLGTLSDSEALTIAGFGGFTLLVLVFRHSALSRC